MHEPPIRFPKNAPGDFYTTGYCLDNGQWSGECLQCGLPEAVAPLLMAQLTEDNDDTYFLRQPESDEELSQAIEATHVCCLDAVRYCGRDKQIIRSVYAGTSDFKISITGNVVPAEYPWWKLR